MEFQNYVTILKWRFLEQYQYSIHVRWPAVGKFVGPNNRNESITSRRRRSRWIIQKQDKSVALDLTSEAMFDLNSCIKQRKAVKFFMKYGIVDLYGIWDIYFTIVNTNISLDDYYVSKAKGSM